MLPQMLRGGSRFYSAVAISGLMPPRDSAGLGSGSGGTSRGGTAMGGGSGQLVQAPRSGITRFWPSWSSDLAFMWLALRTAETVVLYRAAIRPKVFPAWTTC